MANNYLVSLMPGERMTMGAPLLKHLSSRTPRPARRVSIGSLALGDLSGWASVPSCRIHYGVGGVLELLFKCGHTSCRYIESRPNMDSPAIQTCIRLAIFMGLKSNLLQTVGS